MFRIGAKYRAAPKRVLNTRLISVHHRTNSFGILYQTDLKKGYQVRYERFLFSRLKMDQPHRTLVRHFPFI
jgi:hypothetical protein